MLPDLGGTNPGNRGFGALVQRSTAKMDEAPAPPHLARHGGPFVALRCVALHSLAHRTRRIAVVAAAARAGPVSPLPRPQEDIAEALGLDRDEVERVRARMIGGARRSLVAAALLVLGFAAAAPAVDVPIDGRKLVLKRSSSGREKLTFLSLDPDQPFPASASAGTCTKLK